MIKSKLHKGLNIIIIQKILNTHFKLTIIYNLTLLDEKYFLYDYILFNHTWYLLIDKAIYATTKVW